MQFTPYLNFDGNCAEAFAFYAKLFGGTIVHQSTFGEIPPSENMPPLPEAAKSRIMHVQLQIKDQSLMGSDAMPAIPGQDPNACGGGYQLPQGLWVSIQAADAADDLLGALLGLGSGGMQALAESHRAQAMAALAHNAHA